MTIIDFMRRKLSEYPKIQKFLANRDIHIDFTEPNPTNYGLSSNGDSLVSRDITGSQNRRHSFVLYAVSESFEDYTRIANSNFLLELGYWLDDLPEEGGITAMIGTETLPAYFLSASCANAMAMQPMGATMQDGILYQIQISVNYRIEMEDIL